MSFWKRLFGSKSDDPAPSAAGEDYNGFLITPTPIREGGQFRVAARIEKDGQSHELIRADTMASAEDATAASLRKARQIIDEQGDRLFGPPDRRA
jgi:hypothetical protein